MRQRSLLGVSLGVLAVIVLTVLGAAAVTGQAATTQQVSAALKCEPGTVKPEQGQTVGCTLTITNEGGNDVNRVVVKVEATGGSSSPRTVVALQRCGHGHADVQDRQAGGRGMFIETHEVQVPSAATVVQAVSGLYSSPSGKAAVTPRFRRLPSRHSRLHGRLRRTARERRRRVRGDGGRALGDESLRHLGDDERPDVLGRVTVASSLPGRPNQLLMSRERVLDFDITQLVDELPDTSTLEIKISGEVVGNTKKEDLILRHDGNVVPFSPWGAMQ